GNAAPPAPGADSDTVPLRGAAARVAANMDASLTVPTATSVRAVPAKLMADNRIVVNNHLRRSRGGKVSFTHLIGYAMVRALAEHPEMNNAFATEDGKPTLIRPAHVNLGLAIDLVNSKSGARSLVVAAIRGCESMEFARFWSAYEDVIRRARAGKLTADDFTGVTISLTNPGGIGTVHSMPRLMPGMGTIVGVGAMEYPAEFQGMSGEMLAQQAISKIITLTSTYDHRVIQGAQSGEFLRRMHQLLLGEDGFYDEVFNSLRIPYEPVRWVADITTTHEGQIDKAARVIELIQAYRTSGHLIADTNPLEFIVRTHPDLDILKHGLTLWDLDREFPVGGFAGARVMKLRDVLGVLRDSYCRRVGIEYMHMTDPEERAWLQTRIERKAAPVDREEQKHILGRLNVAEAFETFLQTKYVGQKRFSLEGAETSIALLDAVLSKAADDGLDEVVLGMAHRGRLNVLANIVGKSYGQIFREFEGNIDPRSTQGSGDVKYHLGARGEFTARDGRQIGVSLTSNPSHLEAVDPVLEGIVRAKQDLLDKGEGGFTVLPVLVHGDAAFAGQGVVAETLNLSQLRGYRTGGTVHLVINNQVGFTTSPTAARSSLYCTDVARMIQAPIFHVNGDDPEACVAVAKLAMEFRQQFTKDVVIDMVCYRRRGHNEGDDPSMTQPMMYDVIDAKRSVRKLYTEALVGRGDITVAEAEEALRDYRGQLEKVFVETRGASGSSKPKPVMQETTDDSLETAITPETMKRIGDAHVGLPPDFTVHRRLQRILQRRAAMATEGNIDWAFGELLAIGSLLLDGVPVRLTGQDTRRGTFVQRHSVLVDRETGEEYTPLKNLDAEQARFWIYDSLLSEFAAMGFEYGYSVANADALVCWEAQFGDFSDGAQLIVDEFISSGEAKWGQRSGVTLLLPHGYEGQGPDHSSARIERYLAMCAETNMTVANCSTPANYFHLLRRQALRRPRRPLVAFTPKSLLRLKAATSGVEDFTTGGFSPVLPDPDIAGRPSDPAAVDRVLLCAGRVFYDLAARRGAEPDDRTAILRLEQLYPLSEKAIKEAAGAYPSTTSFRWVQEEPANQGAWPFIALNLPAILPGNHPLRLASRRASASPATGSGKVHEQEQQALLDQAFAR
ncbi:MAG: multifunctional oxoglutarate decarboxylase/oxoglutarate dehydrogenase thiamine pyrophosphate-binding subunit/dihydrolipoyllysine-residue succinyltransferase subunit, partial [Mycobacteriales bacterium]